MVGVGGFEPPASPISIGAHWMTARCGQMVGVSGFEPPASPIAIGARRITARCGQMVGVGGFEPPASRSRTVRSSLAELHPVVARPILTDATLIMDSL
jgi:hypothetical protein